MPKIILRCNYLSGVPAAQVENYVRYIATRDRTEKIDNTKTLLPSTIRQQKLIKNILRDIPGAKGMHEYADYTLNPIRRNASEFIAQALEQNLDVIATRENYVDYIANRPGAEQLGEHGLFTDTGSPVVLSQVQERAAKHEGPIWTHVISLRREDAARLGYDHAEQWAALLRSRRAALAKEMKIDSANLRWYAAFHNESHHPHVHLMVYSANPKQGFLTEQGIHNLRSTFAHDIFRQDFAHIYDEQNLQRTALKEDAATALRGMIETLRTGVCLNRQIQDDLLLLAERLPQARGKKVYGFIPKDLKAIVDRVVDELAREPQVALAYAEWHRLSCEVLKTYRDTMPQAPPLSQQEHFKSIKNMVISEAIALAAAMSGISDGPELDQTESPEIYEDGTNTPPPGTDDPVDEYKLAWSDGYKLAREYLHGSDDIEQNFAMAHQLFMAEAQDGNALAMCYLGRMHKNGVGREINLEAAHAWYAKALAAFLAVEEKRPDDKLQYQIGQMLYTGVGTSKNADAAIGYFEKSAKLGNVHAGFALAKALLKTEGYSARVGEAVDWMARAAESGSQFAQYSLGKLYLTGEHLEKDVAKAVDLLTQAAEQENQYAQYTLGKLYMMGRDVSRDRDEAERWFSLAAAQGNEYAQFFLDHLDEIGVRSPVTAATNLLRALARLFENQADELMAYRAQSEHKTLSRERRKKIAQGHAVDDQEPKQTP